jgi:hypothetical protein
MIPRSKQSKQVICIDGVCPRDIHDECANSCYLWWRDQFSDEEERGYDW